MGLHLHLGEAHFWCMLVKEQIVLLRVHQLPQGWNKFDDQYLSVEKHIIMLNR